MCWEFYSCLEITLFQYFPLSNFTKICLPWNTCMMEFFSCRVRHQNKHYYPFSWVFLPADSKKIFFFGKWILFEIPAVKLIFSYPLLKRSNLTKCKYRISILKVRQRIVTRVRFRRLHPPIGHKWGTYLAWPLQGGERPVLENHWVRILPRDDPRFSKEPPVKFFKACISTVINNNKKTLRTDISNTTHFSKKTFLNESTGKYA